MGPFCYEGVLPVEGFSSNGEQWVNRLSQPRGPPQGCIFVPNENIGSCGTSQSSDGDWAASELELGICYIRRACGEPPDGYELGIIWHEHELGDYPTIGITWEGPFVAPWEYIRDAEKALTRFDEAVDRAAIAPQEEADIGDEDEEEPEEEHADSEITGVNPGPQQTLFAPEPDPVVVEIYRCEELLELCSSDWQMALLIFRELGWTPERPVEA